MNIKLKTALIAASIVVLLVAALLVVIIGRNSEDYEDKLVQAGVYLESRDYDNAIAIYNRIISEDRTCAEAYAGLSEAYFAKSREDKALEILEKGAANTDNAKIITDKRNELFPGMQFTDAFEDDEDSEYGEDVYEAGITSETTASETEISVSETEAPVLPEETETESATTVTSAETTAVTTTVATTVPTTAATTVPTTAAPVIVTTAPPPVTTTAPPATTRVTTRATTVPTTVTTTTVTTTTIALRDVTVTDFTAMSLDEAYAWCSKNNIILNVVGSEDNSAKIVSQSPAPGAAVKENDSVIVVLEE
ncbi:MAG: tetratricopeptide repeat protein [Eubacterium sp.]|nr:tetratricopeptide repeat protein [Eubacterium sp.]